MCFTIFCEIFSCAACETVKGACSICKFCCEFSFKQQIKISYIFLLIFSIIFIIFISDLGTSYLYSWRSYIHCNIESGGDLNCLGVSAIYRTSFCLFVLHMIILLICLSRSSISKSINEDLWLIKIFFFIGILYLSFYIPNPFFELYSDIAKIIAISFILFQIIMMIDLFYLWGEKWINFYNNNGVIWGYLLIIYAVLLYTSSIVINILCFTWFTKNFSFNSFLIILNLILILVSSLLSISGIVKNGSLLTSGAVGLYQSFFLWSGLTNTNSKTSNYFYRSSNPLNIEIFIGCITIILSLFYASFHQSYLGENPEYKTKKDIENQEENIPIVNNENNQNSKKEVDIYRETNVFIYFHIVMILSTFFISMLFTNWGAPNLNQQIVYSYNTNELSYWLQIISSWTLSGIYIWTLVAPKILTNRDFD